MNSGISTMLLPKGGGARRLALACASAWVSVAIIALAIVLQVIDATGSYSAAGLAAAAYGLAAALVSVPRSRLVDRYGPRRTLPALAAVQVTALLLMIGAARMHAGGAVFVVLAAVVSGSTPPLIGFARGRWSDVVPEADLPRAYALTAMLGDLAQIGGAPAAALLATLLNPSAGLAVAALFTTLGLLLIGPQTGPAGAPATDGADEPAADGPAPKESRGVLGAIGFPGLRTIAVGGIGAGLGLGAVDVVVVALATDRGDRWAAGLMLGALGVGGVVGSVLSPKLATYTPGGRYVAGLALLLVSTLALVPTPPEPVVGALLLVVGLAWGVTNVVLYELLDIVVPKSHSTEAWAWLSTAESVGAAAGAALAGALAAHSLTLGFAVIPAAVAAGLLAGLVGRHTLTAPEPAAGPSVPTVPAR
ncbi:MFS transporter [Kitasatospora sp. NPDC049258]|uniref:MFS transporter n=1 Tax=Kitasatospora sp. NPDC049258 TaxID=3155394 RepID=UPI00344370DC